MTLISYSQKLAIFLAVVPAFTLLPAKAQEADQAPPRRVVTEGRPSAPVPINANVTQVAAGDGGGDGVLYEKMRIKRTVNLDPAAGLSGNWDPLYTVQDTSGGARTAYCNWDDEYLYLAIETVQPTTVRFDIDGRDDGWLRGADNIALQITPPTDGSTPTEPLRPVIQRFDTAQNRDQPVWAASPIPADAVKVMTGRTPQGTYAVCIALPRTETIGLDRKGGKDFGLRADAGSMLPPLESDVTNITVKPMLRLTLADHVEASGNGLVVSLQVASREVTPNDTLKASLEVKNTTPATQRVGKMYLRGLAGSSGLVDSATFTGADIPPGKSIRREFRTNISPTAPFGALSLVGSVETTEGSTLGAYASFAKVEPYQVFLQVDQSPIPSGSIQGKPAKRDARVTVLSRANARETAKITLKLPDGWTLDKGELTREARLGYSGDVNGTLFRILVPAKADPGAYPINLTVEAAGRTYTATGTINVQK